MTLVFLSYSYYHLKKVSVKKNGALNHWTLEMLNLVSGWKEVLLCKLQNKHSYLARDYKQLG